MTRPKKQYFFSKKFRFSFLRPEKRAQKSPGGVQRADSAGEKTGKITALLRGSPRASKCSGGSGQQDASESEADAGSRNPTLARSA